MMIQQSNCFVVVERGKAMNNMMQERALNQAGELRKNSKMQKGQVVAADYTITPSVSFSQKDTGGLGASVGSMLGYVVPMAGGIASAIGGSVSSNEASTMLLMTENRSGVQIAAAEGNAKNWDFGAVGSLFTSSNKGATVGGYSNTPEGKVLAASFMDSYNGMVKALRSYKAQSVAGGMGTGGTLKVSQ